VQGAGGADGRNPRQVWAETFAPDKLQEAGGRAPEVVPNLGDAAYWRSDAKSGALYVLKGNIYLRVFTGGNDDGETKIEKCSQVVRKALGRL